MTTFECWSLLLNVATLLALAVYTILTFLIVRSSWRQLEFNTRPVVGFRLSDKSEKAHIWFEARNYSNTDAIGTVSIRFSYDGEDFGLLNPEYSGKSIWNFPAAQGVEGHIEFSGILRGKNIPDIVVPLRMTIRVEYLKWDSETCNEAKGASHFSAQPKIYEWRGDKWVSVLTN